MLQPPVETTSPEPNNVTLIPLRFTLRDFEDLHSLSLPVKRVRSLLVRDIYVRWKELLGKRIPGWNIEEIIDGNKSVPPGTVKLASKLPDILKGFIKPSIFPKIRTVMLRDYKTPFWNLFQRAISNGYIYSQKTLIHYDVLKHKQAGEKFLPNHSTNLPYPGPFSLPIQIVHPLDPNTVLYSPLAYISRLEFLSGLSGFGIPPGHSLYDKLDGLKVLHPLEPTGKPRFSPPHFTKRLLPLIKLSESDSSYIKPIFAGNNLKDYHLALEHKLPVRKSIDIHGQVNFLDFLDIIGPLRESEFKGPNGACKQFFDLEVDGKLESIVVFEGRKNIPIPHANAAIYNHLQNRLIQCNDDNIPKDSRVIPGRVEPIVNNQWYISTQKVRKAGLEEYFRQNSEIAKSNVGTLLTRKMIKDQLDFPLTTVAKRGRFAWAFGLDSIEQKHNSDQRYFPLTERVDGFVNMPDWAARVVYGCLDWYSQVVSPNETFSQLPISVDYEVLKTVFLIGALTLPDLKSGGNKKLLLDEYKPEKNPLKINDTEHMRQLLDSIVVGQEITTVTGFDLGNRWTLNEMKRLREGGSVTKLAHESVPESVPESITESVPESDEVDLNRPRFTRKIYEIQRGVLLDSLDAKAVAKKEAKTVSERDFDDLQTLLSCFFQLADCNYCSTYDKPVSAMDQIDEEMFIKYSRPYERYTLYSLRELESDVWRYMSQHKVYEAKQAVDSAILLASGQFMSAMLCELMDQKTMPVERLMVIRTVYETVVRLVTRLAYPFYPTTSENVFYSLESSFDAAQRAQERRKLMTGYTGVGSVESLIPEVELTREQDYEPGKMMFDIVDTLEGVIARHPDVPREEIRAYLTVRDFNELSAKFGYEAREDVNDRLMLLVKRICRVARVSIPVGAAVYNTGRLESVHMGSGLNLHVFDRRRWTTSEEYGARKLEEKKQYAEQKGVLRILEKQQQTQQ